MLRQPGFWEGVSQMKKFRYEGLTSSGAPVSGVVEAFDKDEALTKARENCSVLTSVEPVKAGKLDKILNADIGAILSGGKVKPKVLALLCSQLAIELKAGLPLVKSLRLTAENEPDKRLKGMLEEVADDVQAGNGLGDSFAARAPYLPRTFVETIRAGEESGKLDESFARLQKYYENEAETSGKVGSALIYPILLIVVAVVVVAIIMIKAVPVFEDTFTSLGNELPWPTRALIAVSHFFQNNWIILLAVVIALVIAVKLFGKTKTGSHLYARLALIFPGIGQVNRMNGATQFSSTFATLLSAGIPLVQAARITSSVVENILIGEDIAKSADGVVEGGRLCDGLKKSKWLPKLLTEMVGVGEETGKMEETLDVVSEYYTREVGTAVTRALGILEPVIVIFMAAIVVFILLSVYLPLFSMYGTI